MRRKNMGAMHRFQAIRQYQNSGVAGGALDARPEQLVSMLLEGVLDRLARARGASRNGDHQVRIANVRGAISILEYLRVCLDKRGGQITERLDALYDFCLRRLAQANAAADPAMLEEVSDVLRPLKAAWDELPAR
ncbi:MAG TPA: flagellar export chaperone FliS [Nevskiaceae bacterium]|nr:flagellar export chaperone FliS [Nevskiaceae bacterium]